MKYFPWILAFFWLVARVSAGRFMGLESAKSFGVLSNILLVLILIFITIYNKYKTPLATRPTFMEDVKDCMKVAIKYTIAATAAIGLYYGVISNDVEVLTNARIEMFEKEIASEEGLNKFHQEFPKTKDKSREELMEMNKENVATFVSVKTQIFGGFISLLIVSLIYTMMAVVIWRTIMARGR